MYLVHVGAGPESIQSEWKECDSGWTDWIEKDVITGFWIQDVEQLQVALTVGSPA